TTLDLRQDSSVLRNVTLYLVEEYGDQIGVSKEQLVSSEASKQEALKFDEHTLNYKEDADPLIKDIVDVIRLIKDIQKSGSERAAQRFIISNCQQASDILGLMQLFLWGGWKKKDLTIDFVPLFETVDDL